MRTIGLIGGMSWESTAVYYRLLNEMARERLGGLHSAEIVLWSFDFAEIEALQAAGEWQAASDRLADVARRLAAAGADCIVICTNTMHRMADAVEAAAGVPLIHIADATAEAVRDGGSMAPLLLGTRFTMEGNFYRGRLAERHGLAVRIPDEGERAAVHDVIYDELCVGVIDPKSRAVWGEIVDRAVEHGADSVIFGCTEVGLLLDPDDLGVPAYDSTRLHARAALDFALQ